ncbi:MAG: thioredoxin [Clostridia bacterium]|nr:thioredoxin [Clostridia bacterium]
MDIMEIENAEQFQQEVINSEGTVFIDFYAEWCMPCKMMGPVIEELAKEHNEVKFVKINVDENEDLAMKYNVISIPTMIVMKNGEVSKTFVGVTSKNDIVKEF